MIKNIFILVIFLCATIFYSTTWYNDQKIFQRGKLTRNRLINKSVFKLRGLSSKNSEICNFSFDNDFLEKEILKFSQENISLLGDFVNLAFESDRKLHLNDGEVKLCNSISCLYEEIYRKAGFSESESQEIGHKASIYYIKTGSMLVANNHHNYDRSKGPLKEHLFTKDEVDAFWRLTYVYNPQTVRLPMLKGIYRIRAGYLNSNNKNAQAVTSFNAEKKEADHFYHDFDLLFSGDPRPDGIQPRFEGDAPTGTFPGSVIFRAAPHERAHMIHFQPGFEAIKHKGLNWLEIANWSTTESFGSHYTKEEIKAQHSITPYAAESWREDFAESITYYYFYPDALRSVGRPSYDFIKNAIFNGREYTMEGHKTALVKAALEIILKSNLSSCKKDDSTNDDSSQCTVTDQLNNLIAQTLNDLSFESPEFCHVHKKQYEEIRTEIYETTMGLKESDYSEQAYQQFQTNFYEKYDLMAIAVINSNQSGDDQSFKEKVYKIFEEEFPFPEEKIEDAWRRFSTTLNYREILLKAKEYYPDLLIDQNLIKQEVAALWNNCLDSSLEYNEAYGFFKPEFVYSNQQQVYCIGNTLNDAVDTYFNSVWDKVETDSADDSRKNEIKIFIGAELEAGFSAELAKAEQTHMDKEKEVFDQLLASLDGVDSVQSIGGLISAAKSNSQFVILNLDTEVFSRSDGLYKSLSQKMDAHYQEHGFGCYSSVVSAQLKLNFERLIEPILDELKIDPEDLDIKSLKNILVVNFSNVYVENGCTLADSEN